jgi:hypothetical protein
MKPEVKPKRVSDETDGKTYDEHGLGRLNDSGPFSTRHGFDPFAGKLQTEGMDSGLRTRLWNVVYAACFKQVNVDTWGFAVDLWCSFLKQNSRLMEGPYAMQSYAVLYLEPLYLKLPWYRVYDLLETIAQGYPFAVSPNKVSKGAFLDAVNSSLQEERSAFRLIGDIVAPIISEEQRGAVAMAISIPPLPVQRHLKKALALLSEKKSPDYANSMKESISAVEAICKIIASDENADLTAALREVDKRLPLHGALKNALNSLYGYSSSEAGIRHASVKDSDVDLQMAIFFLTVCSAFINYLVAEAAMAGIELRPNTVSS